MGSAGVGGGGRSVANTMSNGVMDPADFYATLRSYRQRLGALLDAAREVFLRTMRSDSNVLTWYDRKFWVDRVRWLVLPLFEVEAAPADQTLDDDGEGGAINEKLAVYGGASRVNSSDELTRVLGSMLAGTTERHSWTVTGADLLNLAVVQPLVNPAFGPLFWLALAEDLPGPADNLYTALTPMMFDMSVYPTRVPGPREVRRAQGQFLLELTAGLVGGDAEQRAAEDWLRICTWQLYAQYPLMNGVFREVWSRTTQAEIEAREAQR
jgi:hypothetical protein